MLDAHGMHLLAEIQLEKIQAAIAQRKTGRGGDRFDPDRVFRAADFGARFGGAGARMRGATHARRQEHGRHHHSGRPRHQGGRAGRTARAGAHRGYGAVFRGRYAFQLPPGARVQEPLRRGERARRVRHDREGPARGEQPVRAVSVAARRRRWRARA